ncbi:MAG: hypothetical protein KAW56_10930 [Candidatus Marinimicrobia bacterium]|nr:hypothetical protein [Candidatus Neomarinimicrobiota bacterium]
MKAFREIKTIKDNKIVLTLPKSFKDKRVEIIILPYQINDVENEDKKYWQLLGEKSLENIWNNQDDEVYSELL